MRVLVTGGAGLLGRFVVEELTRCGHNVVSVDRSEEPPDQAGTTQYLQMDLADPEPVRDAMASCDAVIHLAAIPAPVGFPAEEVFVNNTRATFHVLNAAVSAGIERAAIASSVSAYGMAWARQPFAPLYAPLDEHHPLLVQDPYGLSKEVDERTAEMMHRRSGMRVAALRFHWVAPPAALAGMEPAGLRNPADLANNLWGYVDARDAASACRHAIECDGFGFEAFNITAADTLCTEPTEELIGRYLPETELRASISGTKSGFSIEKAGSLLGWQPHHSWRKGTSGV